MTEREIVERVQALCRLSDGLRMPSHRHSAESFMVARDELRTCARRLYKDLTGTWPGESGQVGPERRARPAVPTAMLRHRARVRTAAEPT